MGTPQQELNAIVERLQDGLERVSIEDELVPDTPDNNSTSPGSDEQKKLQQLIKYTERGLIRARYETLLQQAIRIVSVPGIALIFIALAKPSTLHTICAVIIVIIQQWVMYLLNRRTPNRE